MNTSFLAPKKYAPQITNNDLRLGHLLTTAKKSQYVLLGYPDDQGIKTNGGRIGAAEGPDKARAYLYKMTNNAFTQKNIQLYDHGNLIIDLKKSLLQRHQQAEETAFHFLKQNKKVISIGGGHDYGYPDGASHLRYCQEISKTKPLIINIDAHLDVRPLDKGISSGTPFYRLLQKNNDIDFFQIGIQPQCNSQEHLNWCLKMGGKVLSYDEILLSGNSFAETAGAFLQDQLIKPRPCFLSIDIDAFSSSYAMGCSQSWPTGLTPHDFFPWLDIILQRLNVLQLGIYELSPPLDLDDRTSKLVSQIIYRYLNHE